MRQNDTRNSNPNEVEIELNIGGMFHALWHRAPIIILTALVCGMLAFGVSKLFYVPLYSSTTSMYVLIKSDEDTVTGGRNLTTSDLQVGSLLTKDYEVLIKSRKVAEEVIENLGLKCTAAKLQNVITVEVPANTRVIQITAVSTEPKLAMEIADTVREVASEEIMSMMDVENIQTVDTANQPTKPYNNRNKRNAAIGAIGGFVAACLITIFLFLTNDSIKTSEDIEKYLHISTLATIPLDEDGVRNSRKERKKQFRKAERAKKHKQKK